LRHSICLHTFVLSHIIYWRPIGNAFVDLDIAGSKCARFVDFLFHHALTVHLYCYFGQGHGSSLCIFHAALSLLFLAAGFFTARANIFQIGFRQRILSTVSPAELREIARVCSTAIPLDGRLPGPQNWSPSDEPEYRGKWNVLIERTSLGKLDAPTVIFNHADSVEIDWGGALVGHWGIIIQKNGSVGGDIAPDIRTVGPS
jgi:hypothetical protein